MRTEILDNDTEGVREYCILVSGDFFCDGRRVMLINVIE